MNVYENTVDTVNDCIKRATELPSGSKERATELQNAKELATIVASYEQSEDKLEVERSKIESEERQKKYDRLVKIGLFGAGCISAAAFDYIVTKLNLEAGQLINKGDSVFKYVKDTLRQ